MDFSARFISIIVPIIAECAKRFKLSTESDLMALVENVSNELAAECSSSACEGAVTNDQDLTHIQGSKLDLHALMLDIIDKLKNDIKLELKVELFLELEKIRNDMSSKASAPEIKNTHSGGMMPQFSLEMSSIEPILGGYSSIEDKITFDVLANNPSFARVNKNFDHAKNNKAAYMPDEHIALREGRFDADHIEKFKKATNESSFNFLNEAPSRNSRWDKMFNISKDEKM